MCGHRQFAISLFLSAFVLAGLAFGDDNAAKSTEKSADNCCGSCSSCDDCDCNFEDCCGPLWTMRADGIWLHMSKPNNAILVTNQSAPGGTVLLNANEFDMGWSGGWDLSLIRHNVLDSEWDIEGLYFSVDNWFASRGVVNSPNGAWVRFVTPIGNSSYASDISGTYSSGLHNVELNARREIGERGEFLVGFRYIDLRENSLNIFQTVLATPPNPVHYDIRANNDLAGVQIGYDGLIFARERLAVDGVIKAGVFNDKAGNNVAITQSVGPSYHSSAKDDNVAFAGDLTFTLSYKINDYWLFRAGYQLLWLEGVALASDQVAVSDPINGTATVSTKGSPFYHGAIFGLECCF